MKTADVGEDKCVSWWHSSLPINGVVAVEDTVEVTEDVNVDDTELDMVVVWLLDKEVEGVVVNEVDWDELCDVEADVVSEVVGVDVKLVDIVEETVLVGEVDLVVVSVVDNELEWLVVNDVDIDVVPVLE